MSVPVSMPSPIPLNTLNNSGPMIPEWQKRFMDPINEDDPLWKEYIEEAAKFDTRMMDQWNKVIDVVLVYVALFTAVLTAFVIGTAQQFQPDPANISNQLLVAIYKNQLSLLQKGPPDIINTAALFKQDPADYHKAVYSNALLFTGLALSVIVSMIALTAKLWVINYGDQVNSTGSPYERAMRRQEAYSGVLSWKLGPIIHALPFLLLVAVGTFALFIFQSIGTAQSVIGYVVGAMFSISVVFILLVSMAAAFIPGCPFYSSVSSIIKFVFDILPGSRQTKRKVNGSRVPKITPRLVRIVSITLVSGSVLVFTIVLILRYSGVFYSLICLPIAGGFSFFENPLKLKDRRLYRHPISHWFLVGFMTAAPPMVAAGFFATRHDLVLALYCASSTSALLFLIVGRLFYNSIPDTREADAIAWLLKSTSSQKPLFFEKAGKIAETNKKCKALLLNSLLPLLSPLIDSLSRIHKQPEGREPEESQTPDLETYMSCLAQLSSFENNDGSFWKNEAALAHPVLPGSESDTESESNTESLLNTLRELKDSTNTLISSAAKEVLRHYGGYSTNPM